MANKWDDRFIAITKEVAKWSSCKRRQVGSILVKDKRIIATGYNGAVEGMTSCVQSGICLREVEKIETGKNQELCFAVHAEQNAIAQAAKLGISVKACTLYCTHKPCSICAKIIVNSGIKEVVYENDYPDELTDLIFEDRVECRQFDTFSKLLEKEKNREDKLIMLLESCGLIAIEIFPMLSKLGFLDAPASTRFHLTYKGGLFDHSYNVAMNLMKFTKDNGLIWQKERSPLLIGLFHDLCKCDQYIPTSSGFVYNSKADGRHGSKSAILAKELVPDLTEEEWLCIEFHMGAFTEKSEWSKYNAAGHKFPNVLWTHQADVYSTYITESDK